MVLRLFVLCKSTYYLILPVLEEEGAVMICLCIAHVSSNFERNGIIKAEQNGITVFPLGSYTFAVINCMIKKQSMYKK